jgi:hypothetical protein
MKPDCVNELKQGSNLKENGEVRSFRRLCRLEPFFGAIWMAAIAVYVDWLLPAHRVEMPVWGAVSPVFVKMIVSAAVGGMVGWARGESALLELSGQLDLAEDVCLRWGMAGIVLFVLAPFADCDYAVRHLANAYIQMLRSYFPCIAIVAILLARYAGISNLRRRASLR